MAKRSRSVRVTGRSRKRRCLDKDRGVRFTLCNLALQRRTSEYDRVAAALCRGFSNAHGKIFLENVDFIQKKYYNNANEKKDEKR